VFLSILLIRKKIEKKIIKIIAFKNKASNIKFWHKLYPINHMEYESSPPSGIGDLRRFLLASKDF
jgi:hypothetical protein